jgi:hypothetical protein
MNRNNLFGDVPDDKNNKKINPLNINPLKSDATKSMHINS